MIDRLEKEVDMLERHLQVLRMVIENEPIGIVKMSSKQNESESGSGTNSVSRRRVLKATGATTVAGTALVGMASAHEAGQVVFCGCGQVCACGDGNAEVIIAEPEGGGAHSEKRFTESFNFCATPGDADPPGGKVVAIEVDGNTICNPNQCAEDPINDLGLTCDEFGEKGGPCGFPPCEHPSGINPVR